MHNKKNSIIKTIFRIIIALVLFALLYIVLLLGEPENKPVLDNEKNIIKQACRDMNLSTAQLQDIINEFAAPALINPGLEPLACALNCESYNKAYKYTLELKYPLGLDKSYKIIASRPSGTITDKNISGFEIKETNSISFAGLIGIWLEKNNEINIVCSGDNINYTIVFPKLAQETILEELSLLELMQNN